MGNRVKTRGKKKYLGGVGTKKTGITRRKFKPNLQKCKGGRRWPGEAYHRQYPSDPHGVGAKTGSQKAVPIALTSTSEPPAHRLRLAIQA